LLSRIELSAEREKVRERERESKREKTKQNQKCQFVITIFCDRDQYWMQKFWLPKGIQPFL
jgi:predicted metalloprotease